jgi:hypothetical protein
MARFGLAALTDMLCDLPDKLFERLCDETACFSTTEISVLRPRFSWSMMPLSADTLKPLALIYQNVLHNRPLIVDILRPSMIPFDIGGAVLTYVLPKRYALFSVAALICVASVAQAQTPTRPPALATPVSVDSAKVTEIEAYPDCVPNAQAGYRNKKCKIQVWRTVPITPQPVIVPSGTDVYVELFEARQNEAVTFTLTASVTTPHQVGPTILQNVIPGLNAINITTAIPDAHQQTNFESTFRGRAPVTPESKQLADSIRQRQDELAAQTNVVLLAVQNAAEAMTCLSNYQTLITSGPRFTCSQSSMLKYDDFADAKTRAFALANSSTAMPLRLNDVSDLDSVVKSFYLTCLSYYPHMGRQDSDVADSFCRGDAEALSTREALLDAAISDIQKAQDALIQAVQTLTAWVTPPSTVIYQYTAQKLTNMVIVIAGTEIVSKASSPISTVTINVQAVPIAVSAGIGFSNLKFNTFTNSPIIVDGQPVLGPNGSTETQVTGTATAFSVITPTVLVSYRIKPLSNANWENRCPYGCSFLISGGVGANLTSKEADFDIGPSFEIANILFTPAIHFGRDTRLTNGVMVGQQLGTNPPSPLPTKTKSVVKAAIVITYSLPLPNF